MVKKAIAFGAAGLMLLSVAGPAMGMWNIHNYGLVSNSVRTKADSGDNMIGGMWVCGGSIRTGAASAYANVGNDVNSTGIGGCVGCFGGNIYNGGVVSNWVKTKADSGDNMISGGMVGSGSINTGAASATSVVTSFVNYSLIGM